MFPPLANGDSEDAKKKEDEKAKDSAEDKPAENGEGGEEKAKKKEVKKTIPRWATLTTKSEKASASQVQRKDSQVTIINQLHFYQ